MMNCLAASAWASAWSCWMPWSEGAWRRKGCRRRTPCELPYGWARPMIPCLFQPRPVAVDLVRLARETGAVAADHRRQRLVKPAVVGVGGGEPVARCRCAVAQPGEIDGEDAAVLDHHSAADHDAVDGVAVLAMDQLVDRIVERHPVRVIEVEQHE